MKLFMKLFLSVLFSYSQSHAAYTGAVTSAAAGAGRAVVEPTDSATLNPATIGYLRGYYFFSSASNFQTTNDMRGEKFALSLTDNMRDTMVPTALVYDQSMVKYRGDKVSAENEFRLAFGNNVTPAWSFGLGLNHKRSELFYSNEVKGFNQSNMITGVLWAPNENTGLAAVFENILGADTSIPDGYRLRPLTSFGFNYNYKKFMRFKSDVISAPNNSLSQPTLAMGIESYLNKWLILRWGAKRNFLEKSNGYGLGAGFAGPKFALNYAYQVEREKEDSFAHSVDLVVPVW
jgi:hypothetical protein